MIRRGALFGLAAAGAALTLVALFAFGGASVGSVRAGAAPSPGAHVTLWGAHCLMSVSMTPSSYVVPVGTPVMIHTSLHVLPGSPSSCARTASYYYSNLPVGLLPANSPIIAGYVDVPGVYHVSVVVVVPNGLAIAHLTMAVAGGA
jgi:hypothetical protein